MKRSFLFFPILSSLLLNLLGIILFNLTGCSSQKSVKSPDFVLRIMETTDIHTALMNFDYYQNKSVENFGLVKTATLIEEKRKEVPNSVLIDNGDLIQGNPLADRVVDQKQLERSGEIHPVYKAMNLLKYDVGNLGNHEFNYGLPFLEKAISGSAFPYICANVYDLKTNKNYFTPYVLLKKEMISQSGQKQSLTIGVIGFVPPQITLWDEGHLKGKVYTEDIIETAEKFIPEMKQKGADLIIAVPHSSLDFAVRKQKDENVTLYLAKVPGVDAILFGHGHEFFPGKTFAKRQDVDAVNGKIFGVPAVMPGFWGNHLGVIDLFLNYSKESGWKIVKSSSQIIPVSNKKENKVLSVSNHPEVEKAVLEDHKKTIQFVQKRLNSLSVDLHSYFSLIQDDRLTHLGGAAQLWYTKKIIQGTEYENLPILSAFPIFKAGLRGNDPTFFSHIPKGEITRAHVGDIYPYPNSLGLVLIKGSELKEWLEMSAGIFNTAVPSSTPKEQIPLLFKEGARSYNFDTFDGGISYEIDLSVPAKYTLKGEPSKESTTGRISKLFFKGKKVEPEDKFLVAVNNYRMDTGIFPGLKTAKVISKGPHLVINILEEYFSRPDFVFAKGQNKLTPDWSLKNSGQKRKIIFKTSPKAVSFLKELKMKYEILENPDKEGFLVLLLNL